MKLRNLQALDLANVNWNQYDAIVLATGFEERSAHLLGRLPPEALSRCHVLGFFEDADKLSRVANDRLFAAKGLQPFVHADSVAYEQKIQSIFVDAASKCGDRPIRVLVDYSVMTRAWYGYMLTWLKYSQDVTATDIHFVYCHGEYQDNFGPLHIKEVAAIPGFEGGCAGARRTVAFFGLGYDKYATLAIHELIEPDSVICYVAQDSPSDSRSSFVIEQNNQIIEMASIPPVAIPLGNLDVAFRILHEHFSQIPEGDEIIAVPMGPKPHVLATLLVAQFMPRVTCMHARGARTVPVQVRANGEISGWVAEYR